MIIITGAAGFIGSCLAGKMNREGVYDLILVDDFSREDKKHNWEKKKYRQLVNRYEFFPWFGKHHQNVEFVFHLGARTDTTEFSPEVFRELNLEYSKNIWKACADYDIPLIYASSAATYGDGKTGYKDSHEIIPQLQPLNPYGESKNEFDKWALQEEKAPGYWTGIKFFNVFGPNEYHKGRMASVVFHAYRQIKETGKMKLFRSHNPGYKDGEQKRDFIYVQDAVNVLYFLFQQRVNSGIYNLGTGKARTFNDLAKAVFNAAGIPKHIEYIDTPEDIREKYQYYTEAEMNKLQSAGYTQPFHSLEQGIEDYIKIYPGII